MADEQVARRTAERRDILKGAAGLVGLIGLQGCAPMARSNLTSAPPPPAPGSAPRLAPLRVGLDQLIDVKCCLRPLRAAGPNLGTEMVGDTLVVHNYGHGGSGWSLSWGSGHIAVGKALSVLPTRIAVVGCGIVGLTAAVVAQRAGLQVTIYARELIQQTRSFRASGSFTPDARVALVDPAGPGFGDLWEQMARYSWKAFRTYLGVQGNPVEFADSYQLSDTPIVRREFPPDPAITESYATRGLPQQNSEFSRLSDRLKDIVPQPVNLAPEENPFPVAHATRASHMHFNFASYGHIMLREFFERGGRFVNRDFYGPADYAALPEKVVINSTGYAARDLWQDKTIIPVRGETGWLVPQPDAPYGIRYRNVSLTSKSDGVVVMNTNPDLGSMLGVGNSMELPNRSNIEEGLKIVAPLFAQLAGRAA
jgi:glycine/D-amino acid oxidase-like deaminating enzyme